MRPNGSAQSLAGTLVPAVACICLQACVAGDAQDPVIPVEALTEMACGELATLEGGRIRLTENLNHATLRVRPVELSADQGRWMLEYGWWEESSPSDVARTRDSKAMVRIPELPCVPADADPPVFLKVVISRKEGVEVSDRSKVRLVSRQSEIDTTRLDRRSSYDLLAAGRAVADGDTLFELISDPPASVALAAMTLPLGRVSIELNKEYRDAIVASSVRRASFRIRVEDGARLRIAPAVDGPLSTLPEPSSSMGSAAIASPSEEHDAWTFTVTVKDATDEVEIFHQRLAHGEASGQWRERTVQLDAWAGQEITLTLSARPEGRQPGLAFWGSPIVETESAIPGEARPPNILMISIDTMRADRLGRRRGSRSLTPHLDRLAAQGAMFTGCRTQAPSTLYGHGSLLTGLPPSAHGATPSSSLPTAIPYLPALLSDAGYATAAVTDSGLLDGRFDLTRGFDRFRNRYEPVEDKVRAAVAVLEDLPEPWLLFLHTYEVHAPYDPPAALVRAVTGNHAGPLGENINPVDVARTISRINHLRKDVTREDIHYLEALYDADGMRTDAALGDLFDWMLRNGAWENTVMVVGSDHGEEFDEHGAVAWHSHTCYEELQRVPLIIKPPSGIRTRGGEGKPSGRIDSAVRNIDVAPTLLELAGVPIPTTMWGRPLTGLLLGHPEPDRETLCEIEDARGAALLVGGWKYHMRTERSAADPLTFPRRLAEWGRYGTEELYDLRNDPGELHNLAASDLNRARIMRQMLDLRLMAARETLASLTSGSNPPARPRVDDEHLKHLRSLGYVD